MLASFEPWQDVVLEVDGRVTRPDIAGLAASFALPADAREVWLTCPAAVPAHAGTHPDDRPLALCLTGISLDDGAQSLREIALDSPELGEGFHGVSPGHRWTSGRARLPAGLWAGCTGTLSLRLETNGHRIQSWIWGGTPVDCDADDAASRTPLILTA